MKPPLPHWPANTNRAEKEGPLPAAAAAADAPPPCTNSYVTPSSHNGGGGGGIGGYGGDGGGQLSSHDIDGVSPGSPSLTPM